MRVLLSLRFAKLEIDFYVDGFKQVNLAIRTIATKKASDKGNDNSNKINWSIVSIVVRLISLIVSIYLHL